MAEYSRDTERRQVLLFIDNVFRYIQAGSEVSALLGRLPVRWAGQPTLQSEMGELQERITTTSRAASRRFRLSSSPPTTLRIRLWWLRLRTWMPRRSCLASRLAGAYPAIDPLPRAVRS